MLHARVLIVEDNAEIASFIGGAISRMGNDVVKIVDNAEAAVEVARQNDLDLVMMDVHLNGSTTGLEAAESMHRASAVPVIFLTADSESETLARASETEAFAFLVKPFTSADVTAAVEIALNNSRLRRGRAAETADFGARTTVLQHELSELEAFTRAVSHDMRGAVRGVQALARALAEDHGPEMSPDARALTGQLRLAVDKIAIIQDELVHFARSMHATLTLEDVDLTRIADEVLADLRRESPARVVACAFQRDLVVRGDPYLLRLALENLLRNAWKYTGRTASPSITFACEKSGDGTVTCSVADNGAGFPPERAGDLFQPFTRLHSPSEFPGTGLGLASVRGIVERHGGRAWATGKPGAGATFFFTLPEVPAAG